MSEKCFTFGFILENTTGPCTKNVSYLLISTPHWRQITGLSVKVTMGNSVPGGTNKGHKKNPEGIGGVLAESRIRKLL
jgi:hypothetical protein